MRNVIITSCIFIVTLLLLSATERTFERKKDWKEILLIDYNDTILNGLTLFRNDTVFYVKTEDTNRKCIYPLFIFNLEDQFDTYGIWHCEINDKEEYRYPVFTNCCNLKTNNDGSIIVSQTLVQDGSSHPDYNGFCDIRIFQVFKNGKIEIILNRKPVYEVISPLYSYN